MINPDSVKMSWEKYERLAHPSFPLNEIHSILVDAHVAGMPRMTSEQMVALETKIEEVFREYNERNS